MYVRRLQISNVRTIESLDIKFPDQSAPGWHVILGTNGAGKLCVVRSLALALAGPKEAATLRQDWSTWVKNGRRRRMHANLDQVLWENSRLEVAA